MSNTQEFYIGQIFEAKYPPETAGWCNEHNAMIEEIDGGQYKIVAIPDPTQEEANFQMIIEIDAELASLDTKSARSLRAIAAGMSTEQDQQAIITIEARAVELRAERAKLCPPATFSL